MGFSNCGLLDEAESVFKSTFDFVRLNQNELEKSKENYWFSFYKVITASMQIKQKKYSSAFNTLKQENNKFSHRSDLRTSDMILLAWISLLFGQIHKQTNFLDISIFDYKNALEWSLKAKNLEYFRSAYLYLALAYEEQGKEFLAIITIQRFLLDMKDTLPDDEYSISSAYNLLGNIYNRTGEFELAKESYTNAKLVVKDSSVLEDIMSYYFNNMGVISYKMGDYEQALQYYNQALELALRKRDPPNLALYYSNIGEVFLNLNQPDTALQYELTALDYLTTVKNDKLLAETYFILVKITLDKENYHQVNYFLEKLQEVAQTTKRNRIKILTQIAQGLEFKKKQNLEQAKEQFLCILDSKNIPYDLETITLTELIEMYLSLGLEKKNLFYNDLEIISKKLFLLGKQTNSVPVKCNLAIFMARIKAIDLNFYEAENILQEALELCNNKNVSYFKKKIENELKFCTAINKSVSIQHKNKNNIVVDKFNSINLVSYVHNLQRFMIASTIN